MLFEMFLHVSLVAASDFGVRVSPIVLTGTKRDILKSMKRLLGHTIDILCEASELKIRVFIL